MCNVHRMMIISKRGKRIAVTSAVKYPKVLMSVRLSLLNLFGLGSGGSSFMLMTRMISGISNTPNAPCFAADSTAGREWITCSPTLTSYTRNDSSNKRFLSCCNGRWHRDQPAMCITKLSSRSYSSKPHWGGRQCSDMRKPGLIPRGLATDAGVGGLGEVSFVVNEQAKLRNSDPDMVAFVTGANRGIGLEIARQLLEKTAGTVIAACRDPSSAENLRQLGESSGNEERLDVVKLDVTDQASVERVAEHAKDKHRRVDLLFNVAGILGDGKTTPGPERSLRVMDREWLRHTLEVNTVGPMMLVSALTPLLESPPIKKGKAKAGAPATRLPSIVVNFSARVGSIGDNNLGGWHSYRMSKSALNMATKGISIELRRRRVWAFSYHPGTTETGLSEPFRANVKPEKLFTPAYTVSQVLGIVDCMDEHLSGGFFAFDGSRIEW